ncbi:GLPGLI family protein [uncultured Winogradskyella sp.]|uniref:GLPGLI family protein n=1 Tax=uncultured Winogradskyella sp. TaxID=395353 RepID=UPI00262437DA|nr:GLPGLI family protein [uncultured Winogradskyella sp.]
MRLLFFILSFICFKSFSQNYTIKYDVNINDPSLRWSTNDAYHLITKSNGIKSIEYRIDKDTIVIKPNGVLYETKTKYFSDSLKFERLKNLKTKTIEYTKYNGQAHIIDTICIAYKKGHKKKIILEIECQNLYFEFRGRYYEAYYAKNIPIPGGPFKFIGAPGMILEVNSFDESVKIKTLSIVENPDFTTMTNIDKHKLFDKSKYTLSYNDFVVVFLNKWYDIITKIESQYPGSESSFNSRRIEILPNKLDPEIND